MIFHPIRNRNDEVSLITSVYSIIYPRKKLENTSLENLCLKFFLSLLRSPFKTSISYYRYFTM